MLSVSRYVLPFWRRSLSKEGTPRDLLLPVVAPPVDGSGRKTTTLVGDHEYFNPTKFHQNPFSGSGEEVENVKSLRRRRRTPDAGRNPITIAHLSRWLRWAKKGKKFVGVLLGFETTPHRSSWHGNHTLYLCTILKNIP